MQVRSRCMVCLGTITLAQFGPTPRVCSRLRCRLHGMLRWLRRWAR